MTDNQDDRDDLWSKARSPFAPPSERECALAELAEASEGDLDDSPEPAARAAETTETWAPSVSPFAPPSERKRAAAEERDKETASRSSRADFGTNDNLTAGQLIDLAETCSIGLTDLLNSISDPEKRREVENAAVAWGRA